MTDRILKRPVSSEPGMSPQGPIARSNSDFREERLLPTSPAALPKSGVAAALQKLQAILPLRVELKDMLAVMSRTEARAFLSEDADPLGTVTLVCRSGRLHALAKPCPGEKVASAVREQLSPQIRYRRNAF